MGKKLEGPSLLTPRGSVSSNNVPVFGSPHPSQDRLAHHKRISSNHVETREERIIEESGPQIHTRPREVLYKLNEVHSHSSQDCCWVKLSPSGLAPFTWAPVFTCLLACDGHYLGSWEL